MHIYIDMDQVLVDFYKGCEQILGHDFNAVIGDPVKEAERNRKIVHHSFWRTLPPMPDYKILWEYVRVLNPLLLTSRPNWYDPYTHAGKLDWAQKHLDVPDHRVCIVNTPYEKTLYATYFAGTQYVQNVLIDDREDTIEKFNEAGGIGIVHKDAHSTIRQLKNILNR